MADILGHGSIAQATCRDKGRNRERVPVLIGASAMILSPITIVFVATTASRVAILNRLARVAPVLALP
jgi:hypothetical protein